MLSVGKQPLAPIAAAVLCHAAVDRTSGHGASDRARSYTQETAAKDLRADHRASDSARHQACGA